MRNIFFCPCPLTRYRPQTLQRKNVKFALPADEDARRMRVTFATKRVSSKCGRQNHSWTQRVRNTRHKPRSVCTSPCARNGLLTVSVCPRNTHYAHPTPRRAWATENEQMMIGALQSKQSENGERGFAASKGKANSASRSRQPVTSNGQTNYQYSSRRTHYSFAAVPIGSSSAT